MSPNKRKMLSQNNSVGNNSFKHRRSSLRVNLSYGSSFADSGNGSFKLADIESDGNAVATSKGSNALSRKNAIFGKSSSNPASQETNKTCLSYKGIELKNASVILEDVRHNEQILNSTCSQLREAIISKTREIFDKENELSIKTALVLGNEKSSPAMKTIELSISDHSSYTKEPTTSEKMIDNPTHIITHTHKSIIPKNMCKTIDLSSDEDDNTQSHIGSTPKNKNKQKIGIESKGKLKLTKKRLFNQESQLNNTQTEERSYSPILSGSHKRCNTSRMLMKIRKQSMVNKNKSVISASSNSEDENVSTAIPVGCSTMIYGNLPDGAQEISPEPLDDDSLKLPEKGTTINIISMEMTNVCTELSSRKKQWSTAHKTKTDTLEHNSSKKRTSKHNTSRNHETLISQSQRADCPQTPVDNCMGKKQAESSKNLTQKSNHVENLHETTCAAMHPTIQVDIDMQHNNDCVETIHEDSIKTVQSSLHVNTSVDAPITDKAINREVNQCNTKGLKYKNIIQSQQENNICCSSLENERESINTVNTSLRMNTSLDVQNRESLENNNHRALHNTRSSTIMNEENNSPENMNLMERLRSVSQPCNSKPNSIVKAITKDSRGKDTQEDECSNSYIERARSISQTYNTKSNSAVKTITRDSDTKNPQEDGCSNSIVEATPYPVSRSVLLRTHLQQTTRGQSLHINKNSVSTVSNDLHNTKSRSTEILCATNKTCEHQTSATVKPSITSKGNNKVLAGCAVILDDSVCRNIIGNKTDKTVVIEESMNDLSNNKSSKTLPESTPNQPAKKSKKKLLPLCNNSQPLSVTPVEDEPLPLSRPTYINRRRRPGKKLIKKILEPTKSKVNVKNGKGKKDEETSMRDDLNVNQDKKKAQKKPRKVLSKKIVVKKIMNQDVVEELIGNKHDCTETEMDETIRNRKSLNDFQSDKRVFKTLQGKRLQTIVIVTTGLSLGDKSLVKSIVKTLGMARIESTVSKRTTHVVSTGVRTINLLHGIIRGCWLVSLEWVLKSLECNKWLNPQEYEMTHFSKAVQENRKDRQLFGVSYIPELFSACGYIYVGNDTKPPCNILKELIKTAGGSITQHPYAAKIMIGKEGLKETWVFDCITTGELQPCNQYKRS